MNNVASLVEWLMLRIRRGLWVGTDIRIFLNLVKKFIDGLFSD